MSSIRTIGVTIAAVAVVVAIVPVALAGGEPKNELPFTRPAAAHATTTTSHFNSVVQGEPKNQAPFTAPAGDSAPTLVVRTSAGFNWADAAIGAAAGIGLILAAAGAVILTRIPWTRRATAAH
jgi:hypothetical protein